MGSRWGRSRDPFPHITNWDDGYEYIHPDKPHSPDASPSYYPPPPPRSGARSPPNLPRPPLGRDAGPRPRYPSPVSAADTFSRPRNRRTDSSPPRRSRRRSPSPDGRDSSSRYPPQAAYGRPARPPARNTAHPLARSQSTRDARPSAYSRSPSPVRMRRPREDPDYRRAQSPPRRAGGRGPRRSSPGRSFSRSPSPPRRSIRPQGRRGRSDDYRAPSPPAATKFDDGRRPGLPRSKTTSTKTKGFSGLSPRWQQAATAAFQAGSAAALNLRSEPGAWKGGKGIQVASAALGAGALDALAKGGKSDGGRKSSSGGRRGSGLEAFGGALGGLLLDQITSKSSGGKRK